MLTQPESIGFGVVLSSFIDIITSRHDLAPWSKTSLDDPTNPEFSTEDDTSYMFCGQTRKNTIATFNAHLLFTSSKKYEKVLGN